MGLWQKAEHDNLRAALTWALAGEDAAVGLRLAGVLWRLWLTRGDLSEGRAWLKRALEQGSAAPAAARAVALARASDMAARLKDFAQAKILAKEALTLCQHLDDTWEYAFACLVLGHGARAQRDLPLAISYYQHAVGLFRSVGDPEWTAWALWDLARAFRQHGDIQQATRRGEEAAAVFHQLGWPTSAGVASQLLGEVALAQGDDERAAQHYAATLPLYREAGMVAGEAEILCDLAFVAQRRGDTSEARRLYGESLRLLRQVGYKGGIAACLDGLAVVAGRAGQAVHGASRATRLFGAAEALHEASGAPEWVIEEADYRSDVAAVRTGLDEPTFAAAWAEGQAMTLEQAIAYALEEPSASG